MPSNISLYLIPTLSAFFFALFIGVKVFEEPDNIGGRAFFFSFTFVCAGYMLFLSKGMIPEFLTIFIGGVCFCSGFACYAAGINFLAKRTRPWPAYLIPLIGFFMVSFYFFQVRPHVGVRVIASFCFFILFLGYMVFDMVLFYKPSTPSIRLLVLFSMLHIALILMARIILGITNFHALEFSGKASFGLTFIYSMLPICVIEMGFSGLLLIADTATRKERRTAAKLSDSIRERDRLYAMVAHELNSPLNTTMHMIEMLEKGNDGISKTEGFKEIRFVLTDLRMVLLDLLNWANRCRSDKKSALDPVTDVQIRQILSRFLYPLSRKNMSLDLALPEKTRGRVDKDFIFIALGILMGNAVRHGKPGTKITLTLEEKQGQCRICIVNEKDDPQNRRPGQVLGLNLLEDQIRQGGQTLSIHEDEARFQARLTLPIAM